MSEPTPPPTTTVLQVVDDLRDRIRHGLLVPGQRLVEIDLTRELGISRGPLREALSRLAMEGLVVIEPYRGAMVRKLSPADLQDLYQVREVLEATAARLAASRVGEGDFAERLRAALAENARYRQDPDVPAYLAFNERFHLLVAEMSGNALLGRLLNQLRTQTFRLQFRRMTPEARQDAVAQHEAVGAAILAGDADAAETAMRRHVRRGGEVVRAIATA
ncbi:MAG: GntR family transcriptional regulator [Kineosporiaceae bacterium]